MKSASETQVTEGGGTTTLRRRGTEATASWQGLTLPPGLPRAPAREPATGPRRGLTAKQPRARAGCWCLGRTGRMLSLSKHAGAGAARGRGRGDLARVSNTSGHSQERWRRGSPGIRAARWPPTRLHSPLPSPPLSSAPLPPSHVARVHATEP